MEPQMDWLPHYTPWQWIGSWLSCLTILFVPFGIFIAIIIGVVKWLR
jgi:hypothetical protein